MSGGDRLLSTDVADDPISAPAWFQTALAALPERGTTVSSGVRIQWRAWGQADRPGLILLHGGGAHSAWWDHIGPHLTTDRRVLAIDFSGHGDSGRRATYDIESWAAEVVAVAGEAGFADGLVVVGHSMGALVALSCVPRLGDAVAGAILVDPPVRIPDTAQRLLRDRFATKPVRIYPDREAAVRSWRPSPRQFVIPHVGRHIAEESIREVDGGWTWKFDPANFDRSEPDPHQWTPSPCPVTVLRAEHGMLSPDMADLLERRVGPRVRITQMPGAGHHVMLDRPVELIDAISTATDDFTRGAQRAVTG